MVTFSKHAITDYGLRKQSLTTSSLIAVVLVCAQTMPLLANPVDGVVSAGNANIVSVGSTLTVNQSSDKAVIDWRGFDIVHGETTTFNQPSASSMTLNRVNSTTPSFINGNLTANGNLIVVNPNGMWFGAGARVDVNGLIASTADIGNDAFMNSAGKLNFDKPGNPDATIVNDGLITAKEAGLVGLVAPNVINRGVIFAKLGRVHLASGDTATVDLYGDGLMNVAVSDKVKSQLVENSGLIVAEGGTIAMTAAAGKDIVNSLIKVSGELHAPSITQHNGKIIIAAQGAHKANKQGSSTVLVDGVVDASGRNAGERGGSIAVTGDNIALLDGTLIDASGSDGASGTTFGKAVSALREGAAGGDIRIGGDYLGQGDTPMAMNLYVDKGALILNDALNSGDAGRTIFWSDGTTQFYGNVYSRALGGKPVDAQTWNATAGGNTGDGGFIETSGHNHLDAGGYVDLTSSNGERGTYFLDPTNIMLYGNFAPNYATVIQGDATALSANLKLWLDASDTTNVNLTYNSLGTTATGISGATTITVSANTGLVIGARIRLGGAGASTAASTLGADTYTITNIVGTTITLSSNLTANYLGSSVYQGYVSQMTDKSGNAANATQATAANMPLWISSTSTLSNLSSVYFKNSSSTYLDATVDLDTTAGNYNTIVNTMYWSGLNGIMPYGFASYDIWINGGAIGFNTGNGDLRGIANTSFNGAWKQLSSVFYNGTTANGQMAVNSTPQTISCLVGTCSTRIISTSMRLGAWSSGGYYFDGNQSEWLAYNTVISVNANNLLAQYQSAKWNLALTPPGSGATEAAQATASVQKGDAVDGYSVFTMRYLERLSQSANISLQSSNNITLDLQGDTLNFATAGRTLSLTAGNIITTTSTGGITTNNGAINLTGTNGININNAFTFNSGTATTTLTSTNTPITFTGSVTLGGDLVINSGNANVSVAAINGTTVGTRNVTVTAGTGTFTTTAAIGAINKLNNFSITADDVVLGGNLNGSGTLTLQPYTSSRTVDIATTGSSDFNISSTEIGYFVDGWGEIDLGSLTSTTHTIVLGGAGGAIFADNVVLRTPCGAYTWNASMTNGATFRTTGSLDFLTGTFTTNGGTVTIGGIAYGGGGTINTNGGAVSVGSLATWSNASGVTVNTSGGDLSILGQIVQNGAPSGVRSFVLNAGTGTLSFGGTVNTAASITATAGSMTFNGAWGGSTTIGAVSLMSSNALTLPSITAATVTAQTTGATVDLMIAAGKVITASGSGDAIKLAAGRNFINNAGAGALSASSGRWLVYSTNPANDMIGSLSNNFRRFGCTYNAGSPSCAAGTNIPASGNGFYYSTTPTLTVTPNTISNIVYGAVAPSLSGYAYNASGYLGADSGADSLSGTLTGSSAYVQGSNIGTYNINYGLGTLASTLGYGFSYANNVSAFTVTPRALSIAVDAKTKVYGTGDPSLTYQITSGALYGSDAFGGALSRVTGESVGSYGIAQNTLSAGDNYTISYTGNNLSITRAGLTVTANAQSKVYGAADPSLTYAYSGLTNGDTNTVFTGALSRVTGENVGSYGIAQNTLSAGNNYTLTYTGNDLTINPAVLTITADNKRKTYGSPDPALTYATSGFANGDTDSVITGSLSRVQGSAAGNYSILQNTIATTANYLVQYISGIFSIIGNDIPVTVTRVSQDPTLNMEGGVGGTADGFATNPFHPASVAQGNTEHPSQNQSELFANEGVGKGWLRIRPDLLSQLNLSVDAAERFGLSVGNE